MRFTTWYAIADSAAFIVTIRIHARLRVALVGAAKISVTVPAADAWIMVRHRHVAVLDGLTTGVGDGGTGNAGRSRVGELVHCFCALAGKRQSESGGRCYSGEDLFGFLLACRICLRFDGVDVGLARRRKGVAR